MRLEVRKQLPFASGSDFYYDSFHYASDPGKVLLCCIHLCHFFSSADGLLITSMIVEIPKAVKEDEKASAVGLLMLFSGVSALISPPLSGRGTILSFHFYTPSPLRGTENISPSLYKL